MFCNDKSIKKNLKFIIRNYYKFSFSKSGLNPVKSLVRFAPNDKSGLKHASGKVRVAFTDESGTPQVVEKNNYYTCLLSHLSKYGRQAFSLLMAERTNTATNKNPYLYNGKLKQSGNPAPAAGEMFTGEFYNWYDYGARMYDPQLGRFSSIDPLADIFVHQSPYVYGANNPIRYTEYYGMDPEDEVKKDEKSKEEGRSREITHKINDIKYNKKDKTYSISETTTVTTTSHGKEYNKNGTITNYSKKQVQTTNSTTIVNKDGQIISSSSTTTTKNSVTKTTVSQAGEIVRIEENTYSFTETGNEVGPLALTASFTLNQKDNSHFPIKSDFDYYLDDLMNNPPDPDRAAGVPLEIAVLSTTINHRYFMAKACGYGESSFSSSEDYKQYKIQVDNFGNPVKIEKNKM